MITRQKKLVIYIMILPFVVIEDTILHENQNAVKIQCFLTIVAISKTRSSETPPGTFF